MRSPILLVLVLAALLTACRDDGAAAPAGFPGAVEAVKALAAEGEVEAAVDRYKALWTTWPDETSRDDAYKITLAVFDAVKAAPGRRWDKGEPLLDLVHWAQAKHPLRAEQFGRLIPVVREQFGPGEEAHVLPVNITSNPYLGG